MFKRGVAVLLLAALMAAVSAEQTNEKHVTVLSHLKHPVVKSVLHEDGKIKVLLQEGDSADMNEDNAIDIDLDLDDDEMVDSMSVDSSDDFKPARKVAKKATHKKDAKTPAKKHAKKHAKQVSVEKKDNGEIVRKYAHGIVRIMAKDQPKQPVKHHKKAAKKEAPAAEERNVDLEDGESVALEFGGHVLNLTLAKNGSVVVKADNETYWLPKADQVDVEIAGPAVLEDGSETSDAVGEETNPSILKEVKSDIAMVAKKFTELAVKMSGDHVSKEVAPIVFVCGLIGALAAIIGVAAVVVGRARRNSPTEDPQSVLADVADEDVEAGIQVESEEDAEDAPAEKSDSLSDSESDSELEEGTFENDHSASV